MKHKGSSTSTFGIAALLLGIGVQSIFAAGNGRIAVVADGNYRDTDDVCGTPVSMAILHSQGFADKLVHYSHSCDITPAGNDAGQGQEAERELNMQISCEGTADRWGAFPNVVKYYNCKSEYSAAVADLKNAINASSAGDLLYIIEAGEPDVIYDAMVAADQSKRVYVRIVTHHPNNDNGDLHDLSDIEALSGVSARMVQRIPDQNTELKKDLSTWNWARDHDDCRITWLWDRGEIAQDSYWGYNGILGSFDCSDAGMIWYWATDEDDCTMADLQSSFTTYVANNPIVASAEAEDAEISSGDIKSSFNVSGQRYVDGSEGFNLTWYFDASSATAYELSFFIHAPSGTRNMGVFVNNTQVGTVSASTAWIKRTVSANLSAGNNTIELRDSEGTVELDVDMLMLTSATGSGAFLVPDKKTFIESGGLVIMEMENTDSPLDLWQEQSSLSGYTGSGYLQFLGNTYISGPPLSPLEYTFKINQAGLYYLHMHCAKETHDGRTDVANDAYVRVEGDYTAGPGPYTSHGDNASLSLLQSDTKYYGGATDSWKWEDGDANLDPGGDTNKRVAVYDFKAGETYTLVISGRSKFFRINRIMFRHTSVSVSSAQNLNNPESEFIASSGAEYVYDATEDFPDISGNTVDYYIDTGNDALAIDASVVANRTGYARASRTFDGESGTYQIRITTLTEEDGESTYRLLVNGVVVATFDNTYIGAGSPLDMQPETHVWDDIVLQNGDTLAIESNCDTNGEIPESGGTAWSRGRWRQIELFPAGTLPPSRPEFDKTKDLLLAQFDSKPDADDVMAQAALGCMLAHPDLAGVDYYGVAGAIGTQGGAYIDTTSLFELGFGAENVKWTDASANWSASVTRVKDKAQAILQAGGKVWVQEAGQSNFTADWIAALISAGVSESVIKDNVIVVQHSQWNEDQTAAADLAYVQAKATYQAIDDGNADFGDYSSRAYRGPETPNYVDAASSWLASATAAGNVNAYARMLWSEADSIIDASGFSGSYSVIPGGGVDFSDCVENWWIFEIGSGADSVSAFWSRYVTNTPASGVDLKDPVAHWKLDEGTGTVANDATGNGLTGSLLNGAVWGSDGTRDSYVSFDGSDDRISTPFTYALSSQDNFTWAWWANMQSAPGVDAGAVMVGNRYPERTGNKYGFIKLTPTRAEFANASSSGDIEKYGYTGLPQGQWHHYAMVKSGTSYQWYVDGVAQGSSSNFVYSESSAIPFLIGGDDNGTGKTGEHFQGFIDDVVLYKRALSAAHLADVMVGVYTPIVTMVDLGTPASWTNGTTWSDGLPAHTIADYIVPDTGNLLSVAGSSFFPGDTLTVQAGGNFQCLGKQELGTLTTVADLIATGGSLGTPVTLAAGTGNNTTNHLAGQITNDGFTILWGYGSGTGPRNLRISSAISGDGTMHSTGTSAYPHSCFIDNPANTFSGVWQSHIGTLVFENAGAVGTADIEVLDEGKIQILGNWQVDATLTVADTATAQVDLGTYSWSVSNLVFGGSSVADGDYDAAELNALGTHTVFTGTGALRVGAGDPLRPVAHWKFDEGTGTIASDSSGNGYGASILNGASWGSDATRSSYLSFDGSDDRIETAFQVDLTASAGDFTWAVWVNNQAVPDNGVIIGNRKPDLNAQLNFCKLTSRRVNYAGGNTQQNVEFDDMVQDEWHHHAVVKSGATLHYYRDGSFVDSKEITTFAEGLFPFYIGGDPAGNSSEHFTGFIDDVVLYDRALTADDVVNVTNGIYSPGPVVPPTLLLEQTGGMFSFSWSNTAFTLQFRTNLTEGVWTDVPGGTSGSVDIAPTNNAAFYRLMEQ